MNKKKYTFYHQPSGIWSIVIIQHTSTINEHRIDYGRCVLCWESFSSLIYNVVPKAGDEEKRRRTKRRRRRWRRRRRRTRNTETIWANDDKRERRQLLG